MRSIPPHCLAIGNRGDTRDFPALRRAGVTALIDLAINEVPLSPPRELMYCRFPLVDGAGNPPETVLAAVQTVAAFLRGRVPVLIVCSAGMSRAPAIGAGAVAVVTAREPGECLAEVVQGGAADVSPALWGEVVAAVGRVRAGPI